MGRSSIRRIPCSPGFLLTEALIAAVLISTSIVGLLALLASSLRSAEFVRNQLLASLLAQEGLEVVRSIRDENWIRGLDYNVGLVPGDYQVQFNSVSLQPFSGLPLKFDDSTGRYQYQSGSDTTFVRRIIITESDSTRTKVIARVSWTTRGIPFSINVEEWLYNWLAFTSFRR